MTYSYIPGSCNLGKSEIRRRQFVALLGLFLTGSTLAGISRVQSPEDRKADRKTALTILAQSALLALVLTATLVALPL